MKKPYIEKRLSENNYKRIFSKNIKNEELEWHFDLEDREIKIICAGDWKFQEDGCLPVKLSDGQIINIKKEIWHRILPGTRDLIIEVKKIK